MRTSSLLSRTTTSELSPEILRKRMGKRQKLWNIHVRTAYFCCCVRIKKKKKLILAKNLRNILVQPYPLHLAVSVADITVHSLLLFRQRDITAPQSRWKSWRFCGGWPAGTLKLFQYKNGMVKTRRWGAEQWRNMHAFKRIWRKQTQSQSQNNRSIDTTPPPPKMYDMWHLYEPHLSQRLVKSPRPPPPSLPLLPPQHPLQSSPT